MKTVSPKIITRLIIFSVAVLLSVQVLLLISSYNSAKKDVQLTAGILISEVFFRMNIDRKPVERLSKKLLAMNPSERRKKDGEIGKELSLAIDDYRRFSSELDLLLKNRGYDLTYKYAIAVRSFIIIDPLRNKQEIIKNGNPEGSPAVSFGSLAETRDLPVNNTYFYMSDSYFLEVCSFIEFSNLFFFLLMKMKGILAVSLLTTIMIAGVSIFAVKTIKKQELIAAQQSDFINNITHEFNTPLNTIKLAGTNLKNEITRNRPEDVERLAGIILRQNVRLQSLVENVMRATILEDKEAYSPEYSEVGLCELVSSAAQDIQAAWCEKEIRVHLNCSGIVCSCDELMVTTAVINILDNAAKYSPAGSDIFIDITHKDNFICLSVKDSGPGIDNSETGRIFNKFYRSSSARSMNVKGLGLGLYFVKKIIDAHSGKIEVRSNAGEGTTITLLIPERNEKV